MNFSLLSYFVLFSSISQLSHAFTTNTFLDTIVNSKQRVAADGKFELTSLCTVVGNIKVSSILQDVTKISKEERRRLNKSHLAMFEERESSEMKWLIEATSQIIGEDTPEVGKLTISTLSLVQTLIQTWVNRRAGKTGAAQVVEAIIERVVQEKNAGNAHARVTTGMYALLLKAFVRSKDAGTPNKMHNILVKMEELAKEDNSTVHPKSQHYNLYLYALANSQVKKAAKKSDLILQKMINQYEIGNHRMKPTANSYTQVITAYSKSCNTKAALRAQEIFNSMKLTGTEPNTDTYNSLMNCWLKSGHMISSQYIETLLLLMNKPNSSGLIRAKPDIFSVNTAIAAISKNNEKDSLQKSHDLLDNMKDVYNVKPDTTTYNLVINAYAKKTRGIGGVDIIEGLLASMEKQFKEGNKNVLPDSFSYTSAIDAVSRLMDSGRRAETIFQRMEDMGEHMPTTVVMNAVINAWAAGRVNRNTINRCLDILAYMVDQYTLGNMQIKPNTQSYNIVLKAISQGRHDRLYCRQAVEILNRMEKLFKDGDSDVAPDVISYTTVISTFARSTARGKARAAERLMNEMIKSYRNGNTRANPNVFFFNAVFNACAYTTSEVDKTDAVLVMISTLGILKEFTKPDHTSYGTMLQTVSKLIPVDDVRRDNFVITLFKQCCEDGQVGSMVLDQMVFAASPSLYKTLVDKSLIGIDIPASWSRNVKERKTTGTIKRKLKTKEKNQNVS